MSTIFAMTMVAALCAQGAEPIRLHPDNPHWFLWRGKATALITSAEHYGAVLNRDFDFRRVHVPRGRWPVDWLSMEDGRGGTE